SITLPRTPSESRFSMDKLRELGDPDQLVDEEDLIVLKLDKPWSSQRPFPKRCSLDDSCQLVTLNRDAFLASRSFLSKQRILSALFAGCAAFASSNAYSATAKDVLKHAESLAIVHNRDLVNDLVARFPSVSVLVLWHDLRLQSEPEPRFQLSDKLCRLTTLVGSTPALGVDHLFICPITIASLLANCMWLREVRAPMHEAIVMTGPTLHGFPVPPPYIRDCQTLILGCHLERTDDSTFIIEDAKAECVARASHVYPNLRHLWLNTTSREALARVADLSNLRRLSLLFAGNGPLCPFAPHAAKLLRKFDLRELTLKNFDDVSLSFLAKHCRNLRALSLVTCNVCDEDVAEDWLPKLEEIRVGRTISIPMFLNLMLICCRRLVWLELCSDAACIMFLDGNLPMTFSKLERLCLRTELTMDELGATVADLRTLSDRVPALRHLATDSYDIRLFFENYRPEVKLAWTSCAVCTAEFPKLDKSQSVTWQMVHLDKD
ncbi:unnamed protein product, partial [Ixodes hexagonus]